MSVRILYAEYHEANTAFQTALLTIQRRMSEWRNAALRATYGIPTWHFDWLPDDPIWDQLPDASIDLQKTAAHDACMDWRFT